MKLNFRKIASVVSLAWFASTHVLAAPASPSPADLGSMPALKASYEQSLAQAKVADTCPTSRPGSQRAGNWGAISQSNGFWGTWQWINAGERHYVKMVGTARPGIADIYVKRNGNPNAWERYSATSGTSTEVIDWTPSVSDYYIVYAWGGQAGSDTVRFNSDVSNPALCGAAATPVGTCFGAVGSNCDGVAPVSSCSTRSDATVECQVSVGSQLHDTCCSHNPGGSFCGGSGNPLNWPSNCSAEFSHATNDTASTRQFPKVFDPTQPAYGPTFDMAYWPTNDWNRGKPTAKAIPTPVGKALWDVDAQNGWCANPTSYNTYWSWQGTYAVCR
jgi:hypothetical protein